MGVAIWRVAVRAYTVHFILISGLFDYIACDVIENVLVNDFFVLINTPELALRSPDCLITYSLWKHFLES